MKTKLLLLGVLPALLLCATAQAQIPITTSMNPLLGAYDQYYLPGPVSEATNTMTPTGLANTNSAENDGLTYVAGDRASKGQSFTTGSNPAGYTLSSVTVRNIIWTNYLNNGTFMSIPSGASFLFRIGTMVGTNITPILTTNATYAGPALNSAATNGTGIYFTFDLSGAALPTLSPNTTYFFEIASTANPPYFELHNTGTNTTFYAGGTAFYGDTVANLDQSGGVNLPPYGGDFAFDANLQAVGAPSVTATVNPSSANRGAPFTVTATVTPGSGTVTNVSVDLSAIGGSSSAPLVLSATPNQYTNTFTIPAAAPLGTAHLKVSATDTTPLVGVCYASLTVVPDNATWTGGSSVDNNWSTTANWLNNFAPALSSNSVTFAGTTRPAPNMDNTYSLTALTYSNTAGSFTISSSTGGTLTNGAGGIMDNSPNAQTVNVPVVLGAAQAFNIATGGRLTLSSNVTGGFDLAATGNGAVTFASPGTNAIGDLRVSDNAQVNITAGTVNVTDDSGNLTRMESNATLTVSSGTLNIYDGGNGWFPIGVSAGSTGTVVVAGGTINVLDHWGTEVGNESGFGVLTINSGTFLNNDIGNVGLLMGDASSTGGTINLNGGTLAVRSIAAGASATAVDNFYFNGGTLEAIASNPNFWTSSSVVNASVRNGGAVVDTAGFDVTITQPLLHSTVAGDNATDGGLTKIGNGTLTLIGGYNYTGPNDVLGGTLNLNTYLGTPYSAGDLVVSNAALILDTSGGYYMPAANVALDAGAVVTLTNAPNANAINGTGTLLVQTNTTLNLNYGALGGANPSAAAISVAGTMSVTGTNNVINVIGTGFAIGQFPLIKYGSGSLAGISGFTLGPLPAGVRASLINDTANQSVDLNITFIGQNLTWYGTNALWDINTTYNWNNATAKYLEYAGNTYGDLVTFDDTLDTGVNPPNTNVILTATLHPSQVTMNNSVYSYVFSGSGSLAGAGSLNLNGTGSLTLTTSNSYTGGTVVNAGTLIVTNDDELGANSGTLTLNGGTVQFGGNTASVRPVSVTAPSILSVLAGNTAQLSGPITGTGDLTLTNDGTLTLAPANTNSFGNLRVSSGQFNVTAGTVNVADSSGDLTRVESNAVVTVSGGTLNLVGGSALNGWFPIGVTTNSTATLVVAGGTINVLDHWGTEVGNYSGSGVLTINSGTFLNNDAGNIGLLMGDTSAGLNSPGGTINLNGGTLVVNKIAAGNSTIAADNFYFNGGTLEPITSSTAFWNNSLKVTAQVRNGGAVVNTAGFNVTIAQYLLHSTVPGDNATDGGLTKLGNGTLTLSGANTYNGDTTVNAGTLELAQTFATLATNSTVTIASGAQLQLDSATVTNVVTGLVLNGTQQPAGVYSNANSSGYITGSGSLKVLTGALASAELTNDFSGGVLHLSWPAGQNWRLQVQTNSLSTGLSTNWFYLTDGTASSTNIPANPTNPAVFFRLRNP